MSVFSPPQPAAAGHDDLIALFTRTLTLNPSMAAQLAASTTTPIYASTHYVPPTSSSTSSTPAPAVPARHHLSNDARLRAYGINPNSLSPSQMQLFRIADNQQQTRLLDLWKIFPPSLPGEDPSHAWTVTTVETEEQRAVARFSRLVSEQQAAIAQEAAQNDQMSDDTPLDLNPVSPGSPAVHAQQHSVGYGGWIGAEENPFSEDGCGGSCAPEPYMMSGYEQLMQRDAQILRERDEEARRLARLNEIVREREAEKVRQWGEQQQRNSTGSFDGMTTYSHFGSQVGGQQQVQYRPAAFDRVYANSPAVATPRDFQRMDMMVQPVGQYEDMEM